MPLSFHEGLLTFRCADRYKIGKTAKVKLTLVYGEVIETPTVSVTVVSLEQTEDGTYLCTGALQVDDKKLPALMMQFAYAGLEGADRRGSKRLACTVRILSRELSSFRAVTSNINLTGVELQSEGPVAPGHYMNLQFDLESVGVPELKMQGVCIWSVEVLDELSRKSRYRVGVGFTQQNHPRSQEAWAKFYQLQLQNEGASVMLKTMDGGSITDKRSESGQQERPDASSSGKWPVPPQAGPGESQYGGASGNFPIPQPPPAAQQSPGLGFPGGGQQSPPAPSGFTFSTPAGEVPQPHQLGGGFASQAAPPPPVLPGKLQLPPAAGQPQAAKPADSSGGFGFPPVAPVPPVSGGFAPPSPQGGGFGFSPPPQQQGLGFAGGQSPPAQPTGFPLPAPPAQGGFGSPPAFSPPPSQPTGFGGGTGFGAPSPAPTSSGVFNLPPVGPPPAQGGFGFASPPPSPTSSGVFGAPPSATGFSPPSSSQPGFGFPPAAPSASSSGGFSIPPAAPASSSGGFSIPPAQSAPPTFPQAGGFSFPPANPPAASSSGGFPVPPAQPPAFGTAAGQGAGFPGFSSQPQPPEAVEPLGINGASLAFRCRTDASNQAGARKQIQLSFNLGGQISTVVISVSISRVEASPGGRSVCWGTVLEDQQKIQVLNQLLSR